MITDVGHSLVAEECPNCRLEVALCAKRHESIVFHGKVCPLCYVLDINERINEDLRYWRSQEKSLTQKLQHGDKPQEKTDG